MCYRLDLANNPRRSLQIVLAKQISGERLGLRVLLNMSGRQLEVAVSVATIKGESITGLYWKRDTT